MPNSAATSGPGRPRDAEKTAMILQSAVALLAEVGYESLRMQDIASRAHVGLGTIYRRWGSKDDVIISAYAALPVPQVAKTADSYSDLRVFIAAIAQHYVTYIHALPSLLHAHQHSGAIRRATAEHVHKTVMQPLVEAALRAQLTANHSKQLAHIVPALLAHRLAILSEDINPIQFADEVLGFARLQPDGDTSGA